MISEEDYNAYSLIGNSIGLCCFENYEIDRELNKHGYYLKYSEKENFRDEIIYLRIIIVLNSIIEEKFNRNVEDQAKKILMESFTNCIRKNLSSYNFSRLPQKLERYYKIRIDDNLIKFLIANSGITEKSFKITDFIALKFFVKSEISRYSDYAEEILKILKVVPKKRKMRVKSFNERIGKDFGAAYKFLNDAIKNKKFDVKNNNSGVIFSLIAVIAIFLVFYANGSDSKNSNSTSHAVEKVAQKNTDTEEKVEQPKQNEKIEPEKPKIEQTEEPPQKIEPITSQPKIQTPPPKKKVDPIPKSGVYTEYDYSQEILNTDGLCEFTVDNTRNNMPVYVRIWDMNLRKPVRAFTIAQGEKFTAENLSPGRYEVRYKELYENDVPPFGSKSEIFFLEQHETYFGTNYSVMELTLYKVVGGNTTTTQINVNDV